jgi:hypothetical protein
MARDKKLPGSLRKRESKSDPQTERTEIKTDTVPRAQSREKSEMPPFQRVRLGTDCFLALGIVPLMTNVN